MGGEKTNVGAQMANNLKNRGVKKERKCLKNPGKEKKRTKKQ